VGLFVLAFFFSPIVLLAWAALLLGQLRGDQHVQPAQHGAHVHAGTLAPWHAPTATIGQPSHAGP
jgi:hypothetical protein